jgi:Chlorophyll A-B binding protein
MKFAASIALLVSSASAFNSFAPKKTAAKKAAPAFTLDTIPGALAPVGLFDPLGLGAKADEKTLKRYREAELTHGRVAMLAVVGFLVGEAVEGSSFLFDAQITGPAISHLAQVPPLFWVLLTTAIGAAEQKRAEIGWVEPSTWTQAVRSGRIASVADQGTSKRTPRHAGCGRILGTGIDGRQGNSGTLCFVNIYIYTVYICAHTNCKASRNRLLQQNHTAVTLFYIVHCFFVVHNLCVRII